MSDETPKPLEVVPLTDQPKSGHTENLLQRLTEARNELRLSYRDTAARMSARLGREETQVDPSLISKYEKNQRVPPIDMWAAWAHAVDRQLCIDLKHRSDPRVFTLLSPEVSDLAREIDESDPETRALILEMLRRMLPSKH